MARDWLQDLYKSSFKGVPFWTERDQESGGRRIVKHQFPMRDEPFLEDLGEDLREFDLTAYLASDRADADATMLSGVCASRGAGILVMPVQGPISVRCVSFSRDSSKDRAGYLGFSLKFCREGASSALVTVSSLSNLIFIAADGLAAAAVASFVSNLALSGAQFAGAAGGRVDFVAAAASDGLQNAAAVLESIRVAEPIEPSASATQRDELRSIFNDAPELISDGGAASAAERILASARALGDAMPSETGIRAFGAIASDPSLQVVTQPSYPTQNARAAAVNEATAKRTLRLALLAAYCEAIARVPLTDRPSAITLRANVVELFETEVHDLTAAEIELVHALFSMRDSVVTYLSTSILSLAPVLSLEANLPMPSLFWAWRLYQDPARASEIVARNRVEHPSLMPVQFEALAK